jgi:hypothetical protein
MLLLQLRLRLIVIFLVHLYLGHLKELLLLDEFLDVGLTLILILVELAQLVHLVEIVHLAQLLDHLQLLNCRNRCLGQGWVVVVLLLLQLVLVEIRVHQQELVSARDCGLQVILEVVIVVLLAGCQVLDEVLLEVVLLLE